MAKEQKWEMPEWMEPYRASFRNTGNNSIEDMMSRKVSLETNMPLYLIQLAVQSQVALLMTLHHAGDLTKSQRPDAAGAALIRLLKESNGAVMKITYRDANNKAFACVGAVEGPEEAEQLNAFMESMDE